MATLKEATYRKAGCEWEYSLQFEHPPASRWAWSKIPALSFPHRQTKKFPLLLVAGFGLGFFSVPCTHQRVLTSIFFYQAVSQIWSAIISIFNVSETILFSHNWLKCHLPYQGCLHSNHNYHLLSPFICLTVVIISICLDISLSSTNL